MTSTHITGVRTISIPVDDQDAALHFFVDTLGFTLARDNPTPNGGRWIELAPARTTPSSPSNPLYRTSPAEASVSDSPPTTPKPHTKPLPLPGVDTDDILRWPGVPAMFAFRDPDGNAFSITETA